MLELFCCFYAYQFLPDERSFVTLFQSKTIVMNYASQDVCLLSFHCRLFKTPVYYTFYSRRRETNIDKKFIYIIVLCIYVVNNDIYAALKIN